MRIDCTRIIIYHTARFSHMVARKCRIERGRLACVWKNEGGRYFIRK